MGLCVKKVGASNLKLELELELGSQLKTGGQEEEWSILIVMLREGRIDFQLRSHESCC